MKTLSATVPARPTIISTSRSTVVSVSLQACPRLTHASFVSASLPPATAENKHKLPLKTTCSA